MTLALEKIGMRVGAAMYLEDIELSLPVSSVTVLLGPTLSGKTSLLRIMAGLDRPTAGRVLVDGRDVTGIGVRRRNVAMVYQQFVNYPSLTVYENIASPLRMARKLEAAEIDRRVRDDRRDHAHRFPPRPSAGAALGRSAAAHGHRARSDQGCRSAAAGRAARQSRLQAARGAAGRDARDLRRACRHRGLCDDRAGRGADAGRQYRGPGCRPCHSVRHHDRCLSSPGEPAGGRDLQRPAHEPHAGGAGRRDGAAVGRCRLCRAQCI